MLLGPGPVLCMIRERHVILKPFSAIASCLAAATSLHNDRISLSTRPGVYFFQDIVDPALKRGRRINKAGVYFLLTGLGARYFNYYFNYYYGELRIFR